ncbi:DUF4419 domain-containing protein [Pseudomonas viridiflava]|uniref:DUF4419 domain-containing protein n=1 Tax=Pseudomonas viridiflava TaxID=33069 RepID=UPI0018E6112D|nr:DUF4419 domain-containing protein [Pseudomonas viridiflava]MBI6726874.1 DUF4419 domain-containing protein [Pseudomonas viridiflava]
MSASLTLAFEGDIKALQVFRAHTKQWKFPMIITLNENLEYQPPSEHQAQLWGRNRDSGHSGFAQKFASKYSLKALSAEDGTIVRGLKDHELTQTGFINVVAHAYSRHIGLVVNPHDIWFVILTNIVTLVKDNADQFKSIFTTSDEKQLLLTPQNDAVDIDVNALIELLKESAPVDISMFLPEFSDTTPEARLAMCASVLDMSQHYYDYGMFCCGIPNIDLRGTREDWLNMCFAVDSIAKAVEDSGAPELAITPITKYLNGVRNIVTNILMSYDREAAAFEQETFEFWNDIFTQNNVGSGGDLEVNGWICDLYHNAERGSLIRSVHDSVSKFPYKNISTGEHFLMVHGAFGSHIKDGYITTVYDHITIEYKPK